MKTKLLFDNKKMATTTLCNTHTSVFVARALKLKPLCPSCCKSAYHHRNPVKPSFSSKKTRNNDIGFGTSEPIIFHCLGLEYLRQQSGPIMSYFRYRDIGIVPVHIVHISPWQPRGRSARSGDCGVRCVVWLAWLKVSYWSKILTYSHI